MRLQLRQPGPVAGQFLPLTVDHLFGGVGGEPVVRQLLLHPGEETLQLVDLPGHPGLLRLDVDQARQGNIHLAPLDDRGGALRRLGRDDERPVARQVRETLDRLPLAADQLRAGLVLPDGEGRLRARRDEQLAADVPHRADKLLQVAELLQRPPVDFLAAPGGVLRKGHTDRPALLHDAPLDLPEAMVKLLGDEGHEGMQEADDALHHVQREAERGPGLHLVGARRDAGFDRLEVPVAELVPGEAVDGEQGIAEAVLLEAAAHLAGGEEETAADPPVLQRPLPRPLEQPERGPARMRLGGPLPVEHRGHRIRRGADLLLDLHRLPELRDEHLFRRPGEEPEGVPQLVGEVAAHLETAGVEADVLPLGVEHDEAVTHRIGAVLVDHLQRVDAVAEGFRHPAAVLVPDHPGDVNRAEGDLPGEAQVGDDHPGDPEEDDVVAGDENVRRVVILELRGLLRPAEGGEGPEPAGEPGVEDVLILPDLLRAAPGASRRILAGHGHPAALVAVPCGNPVPPPELAADAPVADVLHPLEVDLLPPPRHEPDPPVTHRLEGRFGQRFHPQEPLGGEIGLDGHLGPLAIADRVNVLLDLLDQSQFLEIAQHRLARLEAVEADIRLRGGRFHPRVFIEDHRHRQVMALADLEIVGVMGRGHLDRTGAEFTVYVFIGDHRDAPPGQGQLHLPADQVTVPLVLRVHHDGGVAEHGLRPGGGDDHAGAAVHARIADVPQAALDLPVIHLLVADRRLQGGRPVDDVRTAVDQALLVEADEHLAHRPAQPLVEGEPLPRPVGRVAEGALLLGDHLLVALDDLPDLLEELLPPQLDPAGLFPLGEFTFDDGLGGDAGMVRARLPVRLVTAHPVVADQGVLHRVLQRMAHVEHAGDVRRGHHDGERGLRRIRLGAEEMLLLPPRRPLRLNVLRVVDLRDVHAGSVGLPPTGAVDPSFTGLQRRKSAAPAARVPGSTCQCKKIPPVRGEPSRDATRAGRLIEPGRVRGGSVRPRHGSPGKRPGPAALLTTPAAPRG